MEEILGIKEDAARGGRSLRRGPDELGEDTVQADVLNETEGSQHARDRYLRMFWEPVSETTGPVLPSALSHARAYADTHKKKEVDAKSDPSLLASKSAVAPGAVHIAAREGRPAVHFVDVGGKFLDVKDRVRRMKEGERRSKVKAKRRERIAMLAQGNRSPA